MTMVGCFASYLLNGAPDGLRRCPRLRRMASPLGLPARRRAGYRARRSSSASLSALSPASSTALVVVYGRIQPIIATLATGAIYMGVALFSAPAAGRQDQRRPQLGADQFARRLRVDRPYLQRRRRALVRAVRRNSNSFRPAWADRAPDLGPVQPHRHRPDGLCDRVGGRRSLHVWPQRQPRAGSPPSRSAASSPPAADCSSPFRPRRATPTSRRPEPIP